MIDQFYIYQNNSDYSIEVFDENIVPLQDHMDHPIMGFVQINHFVDNVEMILSV
jgi:hypothetical protein